MNLITIRHLCGLPIQRWSLGIRRFSMPSIEKATSSSQPPAQNIETTGCSPTVSKLVDSIEKLTLLETAALVRLLTTRLNIPDLRLGSGFAAPVASQTSSQIKENDSEPISSMSTDTPKQTDFKIILQKVDPAAKAKVIREIKSLLPGLNLVEAKTFVESVPKLVKEGLSTADAEKLKKTLEDLGATVSME